MHKAITLIVGLALLGSVSFPAWTQEAGAGPAATIATVIKLTDQKALPGWSDKGFTKAMQPYLTPALIAAVAHGAKVASAKQINLYDGEFFTGSQEVVHAKLFEANVVKLQGDAAIVAAKIGTSDTNEPPKAGARMTFDLKNIEGVWKIDDFKNNEPYAAKEPSIKKLFLDPVRYRQ